MEGDLAVAVFALLVGGVVGSRVVVRAEHPGVLDVGVSAVAPGWVVVDVAHPWWPIAPVGGAAAVAEGDGEALGSGVEPGLPAEVQGNGAGAEDGGDDPGLAGQAAGSVGGDLLAGVEAGGLDPSGERVEAHGDHDGGAGAAKDGESFVPPLNIAQPLMHFAQRIAESNRLADIAEDALPAEVAYLYDYANYAHPFREGNGRTQREFFDQLLARLGRGLGWDTIDMDRLHVACHRARAEVGSDIRPLEELFAHLLNDDPAY